MEATLLLCIYLVAGLTGCAAFRSSIRTSYITKPNTLPGCFTNTHSHLLAGRADTDASSSVGQATNSTSTPANDDGLNKWLDKSKGFVASRLGPDLGESFNQTVTSFVDNASKGLYLLMAHNRLLKIWRVRKL